LALRLLSISRLLLPLATLLAVACTAADSSAPSSDVAGQPNFIDGELLRYSLHNVTDKVLGMGEFTVHVDGDAYSLEQRYTETAPPAGNAPTTDVVTVKVNRATLKPLSGTREVDQRTETNRARESWSWSYATGVDGRNELTSSHTKDGKTEQRKLRLRDHAYDNESSLWLWRTLAYADGYQSQYVSVNAIENSQQSVAVRVPLRQSIEVPAGTFDTWRLLIRNGRAVRTAWVNANAPHQVVQWDNGDVIFKLEPSTAPAPTSTPAR
jgi:hypothetical protein